MYNKQIVLKQMSSNNHTQIKIRIDSLNQFDIEKIIADEGTMQYKSKQDMLGLLDQASKTPVSKSEDKKETTQTSDKQQDGVVEKPEETKQLPDKVDNPVVEKQVNTNVFGLEHYYNLYLKDKLSSVCYGIRDNNKIYYAVLFNKKNIDQLNLSEEELHYCITYYLNRVLMNSIKRYNNTSRLGVEFQIDMSSQYPLLNDYSFLTKPPLKLKDVKNMKDKARVFVY